jgi:hypothetical protein
MFDYSNLGKNRLGKVADLVFDKFEVNVQPDHQY